MTISLEGQLSAACVSARRAGVSNVLLNKLPPAMQKQVSQNEKACQAFAYRYRLENGELVTGFLVAPKNIEASLPVIIYNRGGTADFGLINTAQMMTELATLASWGYIVIGSQYTGNSLSDGKDEWGGPDLNAVEQLKEIIDALDSADSSKVYMLGGSRGAMMSYMLLRKVGWIKAVASIAGVSDVKDFVSFRKDMRDIFREIHIDSAVEYDRRSAIKWFNELPLSVPILLIHGKQDNKVPFAQTEKLYGALKGRDNVQFITLEDAGHNLTFSDPCIASYVREWLSEV